MSEHRPSTNLDNYDPSDVGRVNGNLFGLPFDAESAKTIVFGVPWEVTVSYNPGTAAAPQQILDASPQLDLYDFDNPQGWQGGIYMPPVDTDLLAKNSYYRQQAALIIDRLERGESLNTEPDLTPILAEINRAGAALNQWLFDRTQSAISKGKKVGVIGGDHSVPLGYMQALATHYPDFGILHIDAHSDLRDAYEGFEFSHASIMFNALKIPQISKLVQVGIRDVSKVEIDTIDRSQGRAIAYYDSLIKQQLYAGTTWMSICQEAIAHLPAKVYISFDADGLDPKLCPNTGTPVPGGLELEQAFCLCREVIRSGREIIGFDLCEVGNAEWDGNVGARIVYKLINLMNL
ncbi:agmatinase family protein [Chamaesiphon minutus]|uniref:Arginase family hydrolase, arginase/agmainase/formiminoglutamate hydrolase n=1 Tax=Chamaesiphon minutus (strain ATCC 27169 / PCC 6605) TaxID=1173020 RepID=K9UHK0_CHAP6|nr:agmatinase family protein [Chamaesiphon minutus]AFY94260.1 arginase family hydrolase, arginase/agmainase/formiminoglutamate hydrolase [Chamaesiphon minutus PCC 6605]